MEKETKNILMICGAIVGLGFLYMHKKKKSTSDISKQVNPIIEKTPVKQNIQQVQFTIKNDNDIPKKITLFDAFNNIDNLNSLTGISINPSMNFFNNTLLNSPKKIDKITVNASGVNAQSQATQIITKICKDASGNSNNQNYIPIVSPSQFQGAITSVKPEDLILDGTCILDYTMLPKSSVTLILDYIEFKK